MTSSVCACSLERLSTLSLSWLEHPIENSSNHVFGLELELWTSLNGVVSVRPSRPRTWFNIIAEYRTAMYQNSPSTCFYVINSRAIWIIVRHVRSANPLEFWRPAEAMIMLEPFDSIHQRAFTPINFLSKSEWNLWGRHPTSALNGSNADVIDVDDNDVISYNQHYLVATSTSSRAYVWPPKATQSKNTMSIWNLSRNWLRFLMGFP